MAWVPALEGAEAERARGAIAAIADDLARRELADPSLARGCAGVALLHGELAREGDERASDRTHDVLARAIELLDAAERPSPWLGDGLGGLGWAMEQLRDVIEVDDDMLCALDASLTELCAGEAWPHRYWLWGGLVGIGVYALARRLPVALHRVVGHLARLATPRPAGIAWWNREDLERPGDAYDPRGYHNAGMALGAAGAAALLAEAVAAGEPSARPLLGEAVRWLLSLERPEVAPRFPMAEGLNVPSPRVRNAWCYGDAAIAAVVVRAGQVLGEPGWLARGRDIAHAMARGPVDDVAGLDATLCCGTAGRAHLFRRLAHALDDDLLLAAARRYYLETLDRIEHRHQLPALPHLHVGATGIALALHAAVRADEPTWDRALLVALPRAG